MKTIAMIAAAVAVLSTTANAQQMISEQEMWDRVAKTMRPQLQNRPAPGNYDPPPPTSNSTYTSTTTYRNGDGVVTGRSTYRSRTEYR